MRTLRLAQRFVNVRSPAAVHREIIRTVGQVVPNAQVTLLVDVDALCALDSDLALPASAPTSLTIVSANHRSPYVRRGMVVPLIGTVTGWVVAHRRSLLIRGTTHRNREVAACLDRTRADIPTAAIVVPLITVGRLGGVVAARAATSMTVTHRATLEALAPFMAGALLAATRYASATGRALLDAQTGLLNRAGFDRRLHEELARHHPAPVPGALILLDLDHFKLVNDTYGHPAGDAVVRLIARAAILGNIRSYDIACRIGGDEFAVILPHTTLPHAVAVADRIRTAIHEAPTDRVGVPVGTVGASLGVTSFTAGRVGADALVERADHHLYLAKRRGRNQVQADGADDRRVRSGTSS